MSAPRDRSRTAEARALVVERRALRVAKYAPAGAPRFDVARLRRELVR